MIFARRKLIEATRLRIGHPNITRFSVLQHSQCTVFACRQRQTWFLVDTATPTTSNVHFAIVTNSKTQDATQDTQQQKVPNNKRYQTTKDPNNTKSLPTNRTQRKKTLNLLTQTFRTIYRSIQSTWEINKPTNSRLIICQIAAD